MKSRGDPKHPFFFFSALWAIFAIKNISRKKIGCFRPFSFYSHFYSGGGEWTTRDLRQGLEDNQRKSMTHNTMLTVTSGNITGTNEENDTRHPRKPLFVFDFPGLVGGLRLHITALQRRNGKKNPDQLYSEFFFSINKLKAQKITNP